MKKHVLSPLSILLTSGDCLYCAKTDQVIDFESTTMLRDWETVAEELYGWSPKTANESRYREKAKADGLKFVQFGKHKRMVTRISYEELIARKIIESEQSMDTPPQTLV